MPDARDEAGVTALARGAAPGHVVTTEVLAKHGTNIDGADRRGATPLMHAAFKGEAEPVKALLAS